MINNDFSQFDRFVRLVLDRTLWPKDWLVTPASNHWRAVVGFDPTARGQRRRAIVPRGDSVLDNSPDVFEIRIIYDDRENGRSWGMQLTLQPDELDRFPELLLGLVSRFASMIATGSARFDGVTLDAIAESKRTVPL